MVALPNFSCPFLFTRAFILIFILERPWNFGKFVCILEKFSLLLGCYGVNWVSIGRVLVGVGLGARLDQNSDLPKNLGACCIMTFLSV